MCVSFTYKCLQSERNEKLSRLKRQSSKRDIVGSSTPVGKYFHFVFLAFLRGSQLKSTNINEINRDIHLAYILF